MKKIKIPDDKSMNARVANHEYMLRATGQTYTLSRTKSVTIIEPDGGEPLKYILGGLDVRELNFIKKVKRHFQRMELPKRIRPLGNTHLYNGYTANLKPGVYTSMIEVDVSAAYWEAAKKLAYLPDDIYEQGKDTDRISKRTRLIALGSLARRKEVITYRPPYDDPEISMDIPQTNVFWDNIVYEFGSEMDRVFWKYPGKIMGYWVDAVFCQGAVAALVRKEFRDAGYPVTIERLEQVEIVPYKHDDRKLQIFRTFPDGTVKELPPFRPGYRPESWASAREKFLSEIEKHLSL